MYPCKKCFENNWSYEDLPDGYIRATCQMCGYEVEWLRKKERIPIKQKQFARHTYEQENNQNFLSSL